MLSDVGCVVVHHKNYPGVLNTVSAILAQGVPANQVVFVDNSEDPDLAARIRTELTPGVRFLTQVNLGYGHAANIGIRTLQSDSPCPKYILISTHEAIPEPNAISAMRQTMVVTRAAVVGPTLIGHQGSTDKIWSTGGELSRILNIPFHTRLGPAVGCRSSEPVERAWLDGAFCLYLADALASLAFREEYFLYFEEVDLHLRIEKWGGRVMWTPTARVSQVPSGTPAYYLTRNMHIFQFWQGNDAQRLVTPIYALLRLALRASVKDRRISVFRDMWRGFLDGLRLNQTLRRKQQF